jgi:hypothetical protein
MKSGYSFTALADMLRLLSEKKARKIPYQRVANHCAFFSVGCQFQKMATLHGMQYEVHSRSVCNVWMNVQILLVDLRVNTTQCTCKLFIL